MSAEERVHPKERLSQFCKACESVPGSWHTCGRHPAVSPADVEASLSKLPIIGGLASVPARVASDARSHLSGLSVDLQGAQAEVAQLKAQIALMPEDATSRIAELEAEVARRRDDEAVLAGALEEARLERDQALRAANIWEGLCKSSSLVAKERAAKLKDAQTAVRVLSGLLPS